MGSTIPIDHKEYSHIYLNGCLPSPLPCPQVLSTSLSTSPRVCRLLLLSLRHAVALSTVDVLLLVLLFPRPATQVISYLILS